MIRVEQAPWDQAVLGLSSAVLFVSSGADPSKLQQTLNSLSSQIVTVRLPAGIGKLQDVMTAAGISFRELQFTFQSPSSPAALRGLGESDRFGLREGTRTELEVVNSWLIAGLISTDRFAADPHFGPALAGQRYAAWLVEEVAKGASLKVIEYDGTLLGFFSLREENGEPYIALSGVNSEAKVPGAGLVLHRFILEEISRDFSRPLRPVVGSSNLPAVRVHLHCGYTLAKVEEVYMSVRVNAAEGGAKPGSISA